MAQTQSLTGVERIRIAARAVVSERTVIRTYQGNTSPHSHERIRRAALDLGLPPPPPLAASHQAA